MTAEDIQRLAMLMLESAGVTRPPVDIDEVALCQGLAFHLDEHAAISGAYVRLDEEQGIATISARDHPLRRRFTKAHELAHHLMDAPEERRAAGYEYLRLPTGYRGRSRHWAHEYFAGSLLMPRAWVADFMRARGWGLERTNLIVEVSRTFAVSRAAAEVRLRELGHIN